jgi:hypothetical protein
LSFIGVPLFPRGRDDISQDFDSPLHPAKDRGNVFFGWEQPRYWAASLRDQDFFSVPLHFIQQMKAFGLELARGNPINHTMVI